MKFMMISCKRATELVDKRRAVGLSMLERLKLGMHTAMCDACRLYEEQSTKIDALLGKELGKPSDPGNVTDEHAAQLAERILSKKK